MLPGIEPQPADSNTTGSDVIRPARDDDVLPPPARLFSELFLILMARLHWTEVQPAQRTQAKPAPGWRIVHSRSRRGLRAPTRNILQPIFYIRRPSPSL